MKKFVYRGKVLPDGHLSRPDEAKERLHQANGSTVRVAVSPVEQGRVMKLKGIWEGIEISDEDKRTAREDMWGKLGTKL